MYYCECIAALYIHRYNGGEGFVPGSMFRKFDRRQGTAYVKNVSQGLVCLSI